MRKLKEKRKIKKGKYEDFILEIPGCLITSVNISVEHKSSHAAGEIEVYQANEEEIKLFDDFAKTNKELKIKKGKKMTEEVQVPSLLFFSLHEWETIDYRSYRYSKIITNDEKIIMGAYNAINRRF